MIQDFVQPYIDGYVDPVMGNELTVEPRPSYPFAQNLDTYTRSYERDFEIVPRSIPRIGARTSWTNLATYSEAFDNAAWTKTNLSITADNITAPDGLLTMEKLLESSATGEHSVSQAITATAAAYEVRIFGRGGLTRSLIRAAFTDSAAAVFSAYFNVVSGYVASPSTGVTAQVINHGNGHFECVMQFTPAAGAGTLKFNVASAVGTISYAGTTTNGVYLWGAQMTLGSGSPYISTTSAARTILAPDRDPVDPFAFLIAETDPDSINSNRQLVKRTFSRVPIQQTTDSHRFITKPDLRGDFPQDNGDSIIIQPEQDVPRWDFYTRQAISTDSGPATGGGSLSGGTYTLTYRSSTTTPIAYNANAGTVQNALNALASIIASPGGSVVVTGDYLSGFVVKFASATTATIDFSGLTTVGASNPTYSFSNNNPSNFGQQLLIGTDGQFTGGTFTVTILGQTTAPIAYNASQTTLLAAVNALSNVTAAGGVTNQASGSILTQNNFISVNLLFRCPAITVDASSAAPPGSTGGSVAQGNYAYYGIEQKITFTGGTPVARTLTTAAAHGFALSDNLVVKMGTDFHTLPSGTFTLPATDQIQITTTAGNAFSDSDLATLIGKQNGNTYTGGSKLTRIKRITDFYLPGVTPGITTVEDIPLPVWEGDAVSLLEAIFNGDTDINYEVDELEDYRGGPIKMATRTTLNASTL